LPRFFEQFIGRSGALTERGFQPFLNETPAESSNAANAYPNFKRDLFIRFPIVGRQQDKGSLNAPRVGLGFGRAS
jgi:hypothetical protein